MSSAGILCSQEHLSFLQWWSVYLLGCLHIEEKSSQIGCIFDFVNNQSNLQSICLNAYADYISIGVYAGITGINQRNYIFENDDGNSVNLNSNMDSANTTTTNVKKGQNIAPGIPFEELPDDFICPECGAGKDQFSLFKD